MLHQIKLGGDGENYPSCHCTGKFRSILSRRFSPAAPPHAGSCAGPRWPRKPLGRHASLLASRARPRDPPPRVLQIRRLACPLFRPRAPPRLTARASWPAWRALEAHCYECPYYSAVVRAPDRPRVPSRPIARAPCWSLRVRGFCLPARESGGSLFLIRWI